jgi:hypothetical protein
MCSQQPALDGCTILAWTGNTMVETAAEIIAKSSSFSVSRIEPIIQLAAYPCNRARFDCSCPICEGRRGDTRFDKIADSLAPKN